MKHITLLLILLTFFGCGAEKSGAPIIFKLNNVQLFRSEPIAEVEILEDTIRFKFSEHDQAFWRKYFDEYPTPIVIDVFFGTELYLQNVRLHPQVTGEWKSLTLPKIDNAKTVISSAGILIVEGSR